MMDLAPRSEETFPPWQFVPRTNPVMALSQTMARGDRSRQEMSSAHMMRPTIRNEMMAAIPTMEDFFLDNLKKHPRKRTHLQDLVGQQTPGMLMAEFNLFLKNALASSTWAGYGVAWSDLLRFCEEARLPLCEYSAAMFCRRKLLTPYQIGAKGKSRWYEVSTVYQVSKELSAVGNRLSAQGWEKQGWIAMLQKILIRMGAKDPQSQADPITRDQVYAVVNGTSQTLSEDDRISFLLAWKTASRGDDLQKANADDAEVVTHHGKRLVVIRWRPQARVDSSGKLTTLASGVQKNQTHGRGFSCVVDCGAYHDRVVAYLKRRKGQPISGRTTAEITNFLQRFVAKNLTCHSIKRGALQYLLEQGVDLRMIAEVARHHQSFDWLPEATRAYLPPVALALAIGTHDATRLL